MTTYDAEVADVLDVIQVGGACVPCLCELELCHPENREAPTTRLNIQPLNGKDADTTPATEDEVYRTLLAKMRYAVENSPHWYHKPQR